MIGTGLGHYTITSHLGTGGMGEVYQATDARLGREVAVKFLPEAFVDDASRLARFQREARALAALNHPHIAAIYGLEEIAGRHFLVMELVRGTTLAARLAGGPLSVDDTVRYGTQIADALASAHSRGIVHRDMKPGNIMVAKSGVKVLDFGLAKSHDDETMTVTQVVMGTPAYMAPEQREGGACDARSDIYSFGLILLEMATGRRAADGDLSKGLPSHLARVIQGCLERDPDARWQSAADIKKALAWTMAPADGKTQSSPRVLMWTAVAALIAGFVAGGAGAWFFRPAPPSADSVVRLSLSQPAGSVLTVSSTFDVSATPDVALTPDGSQLVYVGRNGTKLYVRPLDALEPREVASGYQLRNPFVSPRGDWIGFADRRYVVMKVAVTGGLPVPLPARLDTDLAGATWLPDDTIIFATFGDGRGLRRASAAAGRPTEDNETLTRPDAGKGEVWHLWPEVLPGGHAVLFTITYRTGGLAAAQVWVLDLRTRVQKPLVVGGSAARFVPNGVGATRGHLVYAAEGGLRAIPFDAVELTTSGVGVPVVARLATSERGAADFAVASDGTLVYVNASDPGPATLSWVDGTRSEEPISAPPRRYGWVRVAPDGTRFALGTDDRDLEIGIWDIQRATLRPLRFAPAEQANGPVWTDDSRRIVVQARLPNHPSNLWWAAADGSDTAEQLTTSANTQRPTGAAPGGTHILLMEAARDSLNVMQVALDRTRQVTAVIQEPATWDAGAVVSPDGRWLAYESDVSGRMEIHVCPYPNTSDRRCVQVSMEGGIAPRWLPRTGRELFFASLDGALMRTPVDTTSRTWQAGAPTKFIDLRGLSGTGSAYGMYDVAPDGRIVVIQRAPASPEVAVVLRWSQELARLAPAR